MRRLSLSTKLLIAVMPLIVALGGLLAVTIRDGIREVDQARRGAELGATWEPLVTTMRAIEIERAVSIGGDSAATQQARRDTNQLMVDMDTALRRLGDSQPLLVQLGQTLQSLGAARSATDNPSFATARGVTADESFNAAKADLVAVGRLLPTESTNTDLARTLTAVAALAEVEQGSIAVLNGMSAVRAGGSSNIGIDRLLAQIDRTETSVDLFRATADAEWTTEFRNSGYVRALGDARRAIQGVATARAAGDTATNLSSNDIDRLATPVERIAEMRDELALEVVAVSDAAVGEIIGQTLGRVLITALAIFVALTLAYFITRSITRRVRAVSGAASDVSTERLPVLVEALRDPRGRIELPDVVEIDARGSDELAELAQSFNTLQATLGDVAKEQIEVLRRGVSDIFVTMARRNRSLVDRQLALLDELEASVEDPDVLADYYRLDHLATRMRRNSESLLVLANTDAMRRRNKPASIDDVVRAAIGEVEEYRRCDIMSLEHLNVRGAVVADIAHLLAELLDNATAFSPPTSRVQITGDLIDGEYRILVMDDGMGIGSDRLEELNDLLAHPPVVGLSVEPTLGMSVVSLLAAKHGIVVQLAPANPGTIAKVVIPESCFERRAGTREFDPNAGGHLNGDSLALRANPLTPSTPSTVLDEAPASEAPTADHSVEGEPTREHPVPERTAAAAKPMSARAVRRARRKAEKAEAKEQAASRAKAGKHTKQQIKSHSKKSKAKKASKVTDLPASKAKGSTPTTSAPAKSAPSTPTVVAGEPLKLTLPSRMVNEQHVSEQIVGAKPPAEPTIEVPSDLSGLAELPTRLPKRNEPERPTDELDLAHLDITPSWARDESPQQPEVAPPTPPAAPSAPSVPTTSAPPAPAPLSAPPSGAMLPPPAPSGPAVPPPAPVGGPAVPPPPPPQPGLGTDGLPTRSRSGSSSALLEVDRLGEGPVASAGPPSALKAALSAFDSGRQVAQERLEEDSPS